MPLIPHYRADGPASPKAPAMERGRGPRVDASQALQGVARLAGAVGDAAVDLPGVNPNLGQGGAQGLQAQGAGLENVSDVLFDIQERVAEAKNYTDEHEAQLAMDREVGEFEKWRIENPDPTTWEGEWRSRMDRFKGGYFEGKSLAPVAIDAIKMRADSFTERRAIQVGVDAMRETVGRATSALNADVIRMKEAGDYQGLDERLRFGVEKGWIPEDRAEMMRIQAQDEIESRGAQEAMDRSRAFALSGKLPEALAELDSPFIPETERMVLKAEMENVTGAKIEYGQALDYGAEAGPMEAARALEEVDENGNPVKFPRIKGAERQKLISDFKGVHYAEKKSIASSVLEGIDNGAFQTVDSALAQFEGFELSEVERRTIEDKFRGQFIKDEGYAQAAFTAAAAYDPSTDPTGERAESLASEWSIVLSGDPRLEKVLGVLERKRNGEQLTMPENMRAAKEQELRAIRESEATYRIPAERIKPATKDGLTVFVDTGADVKEGDPGYFETGAGLFDGTHVKGRIITLSQDDRIKATEGKGAVEDLTEKNRRAAEDAKILDALDQDANTGKIQDEVQWDERYGALALPIKDKAAVSSIENGLFPQTEPTYLGPAPAVDRIEAIKQRAAQLKGSATF